MQNETITFNNLKIGHYTEIIRTITETDILQFANISGDYNPVHIEASTAQERGYKTNIAHGILSGVLISTVIGVKLPGSGSILVKQDLHYKAPIFAGDTIQTRVTVTSKNTHNKTATLTCQCKNQDGKIVTTGTALVVVPIR